MISWPLLMKWEKGVNIFCKLVVKNVNNLHSDGDYYVNAH